jgi:hypothetical protein
MRYFLYCVLFFITTNFSFGQSVDRNYNESAAQFVSRFKPENSKLSTHVLETKWNAREVIIAFYEQPFKLSLQEDPGQQNYVRIIGEIFFKTSNNHYNKYMIDTIESEGGDPKIESVFFANAYKGKNKELIILVSWPQVHADVKGTLYGTYVYDEMGKDSENKLRYLKSISEKLSGGCDCVYSDGQIKKAKFKNASDIKSALRIRGFK